MVQRDISSYKEEIQTMIARKIIDEVKAGSMSDADARSLAGFTLDTLETIRTMEQFQTFLKNLTTQWSRCQSISEHMQQKIAEHTQTDGDIKNVQAQLASIT